VKEKKKAIDQTLQKFGSKNYRTSTSERRLSVARQTKEVYDWKFDDVKEHLDKINDEATKATWKQKAKYILKCVLVLKYLWDFIADMMVVSAFYWTSDVAFPVIYLIFALLNIVFFVLSFRIGMGLVRERDISDTFLNNEAIKYWNLKYKYYVYFNEISADLKLWDKLYLFLFLTLSNWKTLILVQIPEFLIIIINLETACTYKKLCTYTYIDTSTTTLTPQQQADQYDKEAQDAIVGSMALALKMFMIAFSFISLIICCGLYPIFRKQAKSENLGTLRDYVSLRLDTVVSNYYKEKYPEVYKRKVAAKAAERKARAENGGDKKTEAITTTSSSEASNPSKTVDIVVSSPGSSADLEAPSGRIDIDQSQPKNSVVAEENNNNNGVSAEETPMIPKDDAPV